MDLSLSGSVNTHFAEAVARHCEHSYDRASNSGFFWAQLTSVDSDIAVDFGIQFQPGQYKGSDTYRPGQIFNGGFASRPRIVVAGVEYAATASSTGTLTVAADEVSGTIDIQKLTVQDQPSRQLAVKGSWRCA
ncbi:MAG: hypothetical protein QOE92_2422 [Chloroflexota bacterium]|nr:hypothetical protein [Chloroflexota bacterium]